MAVKIRLRRMGSKKAPFYRVVVADSRYPRNGQSSMLTQKLLRSGLLTVLSQLIQLRLFSRRTALLNNQSRKGNQNAGITYCNSTGSC